MKKTLVTVAATAALLGAGATYAKSSSEAEFRGFNTCVAAASQESRGLVTKPTYFLNQRDTLTEYFINGSRWQDGEREYVRINCETEARGTRLLSAVVAPGQYTNETAPRVRVEIAQK